LKFGIVTIPWGSRVIDGQKKGPQSVDSEWIEVEGQLVPSRVGGHDGKIKNSRRGLGANPSIPMKRTVCKKHVYEGTDNCRKK